MSLYSDLVAVLTPYANKIKGIISTVGDLNGLETTDKSSIVAAINEAAQSGGDAISQLKAGLNDLNSAVTFFEGDALAAGLDANELLTNGVWQVRGSRISACSNLPSGYLGDIVIVVQELKVGNALQRLYDSNGNVWIRLMNTTTHEPIVGQGWKNGLSGEAGNSTQVGMTQKAVTDALALKADDAIFNAKISSIEDVLPSEYQAINLSDATLSSGGIKGTVGSQITIVGSTTAYCYFVVDNIVPKIYKVTTKTSNSSKYPQYVIGTDNNNVVTELLGANAGVAYDQKDFVFTPTGATTKLYILVYSSTSTAYNYCKLYQNEITLVASQKDISGDKYKINAVTDAALKNREISKAFANNTIKITLHPENTRTPSTSGRELISGTTAVVNNHNATRNLITFGLITDTHKGGQRTVGHNPNYNITAFINATNSLCDFAVHGGDLVTNYYDANYMPDLASVKTAITNNLADFNELTVPLLVTKGNHEIGLQTYSAIETPATFTTNLYAHDDETDTYYRVKTETEFNALKQAGATFYTETQDAMSNAEYEALVSVSYPTGAQAAQNNGAYYYWDYDNKLRIIVLNDFFVKTGGTTFGIGEVQLQFVSDAFDGALSNGLAVMTISHTATGGAAIASIVLDFMANSGVYVGHIHGHEHSDVYTNANGINNIGVNWGCITIGKVEGHLGFAFDIFEIDLENKILYEIRTGEWKPNYISVDRVFDFDNHIRVV